MTSRTEPLSAEEMAVPPSADEMKITFDQMTDAQYKGVHGALRIDAANGKEGLVVGITVMTHPNEPAGLAPIFHYIREDRLKHLLRCGSVIFTVNNLKGGTAYFTTDSAALRLNLRLLDVNMNRLPKNVLELRADTRYEVQRTVELSPILEEFDAGMDIHSTYTEDRPMIIHGKGPFDFIRGIPIQTVLTNMSAVHQRGIPISSLYGGAAKKNIPVIGIEAGTHEGPESPVNATIATQAFLQNLGMIPGTPVADPRPKHVFRISCPLLFPDDSYRFVKVFAPLEYVNKDQVLATGDGPDVVSPQDGHILFPKPAGFHTQLSEAAFIADPPVIMN
ncbi:hypothetical protein HZA87_05770 [Candidatus Uhrbacteria bacterium]|nr:hypothetical protein [Candidatus Uhrbacteria bacterium]